MLAFYLFCLFVAKTFATNVTVMPPSCHGTWQPDYYWRDYNGLVPEDAVEGGYDVSGHKTYIGQITIEQNVVLPGSIHPGTKLVSVPFHGAKSNDKYVKILCSQHREHLTWIATKNSEIHLLTDYYLVVGGYEPPHLMNIGRLNIENNLAIGKVFSIPTGGLYVLNPANEEQRFDTFEVLGYARI